MAETNNEQCLVQLNPPQNSVLSFNSSSFQSLSNNSHEVELMSCSLDDPLESLNLIDAVQRLGLEYRFQTEIDAILEHHYAIFVDHDGDCMNDNDLHEVALRFRLLRQRGYFVSSDVFNIFMNEDGHFKQNLEHDIKGLMSLYEASQLCLPGENKLNEAQNFSSKILREYITNDNIDNKEANHVARTLANPYHTSFSKFMVKDYFGVGDDELLHATNNKWVHAFQQVAKMDFNIAQNMHQQELVQFTRWWKETGLGKALPFARDQPLKWYICSLVCLIDPCFSDERIELSKAVSFVYLIDDMFDIYGSLDQLTLFTEAVRRWDIAMTEALPECMRICFKSLYDMTNEISSKIYKKHGWNPINSLQKSWAKLCDAFLVEGRWFDCGESPSAEEYLKNGVVSTGVHVVLVHAFFFLGQSITNQTVHLLDNDPLIISSPATILRLHDDLGTAKDENQEGYDGSYIDYYLKENPEISVDSARQRVIHMISDAWKRLNQESLSPNNPFPETFIQASQNMARFVPVLYGYDENHNLPTLEKLMKFVLYESVQI
ncbi:(3S,6E)-nerolidol synthase 1-like [Cucumis melo var. makuwa]|uniref:(3S,6E)-nerolidol synthase 1-like n=1 Tax=Cucumis melo var. makuwa TaxID=1194695 RepID=A0A5D3BHX5_CUCMM|nr:(3S,6E)-nerolidol synthase 1-like [Cucumis melo var. makuwa]